MTTASTSDEWEWLAEDIEMLERDWGPDSDGSYYPFYVRAEVYGYLGVVPMRFLGPAESDGSRPCEYAPGLLFADAWMLVHVLTGHILGGGGDRDLCRQFCEDGMRELGEHWYFYRNELPLPAEERDVIKSWWDAATARYHLCGSEQEAGVST